MRLAKLLLLLGTWLWVPIVLVAFGSLVTGGGLPGPGTFLWASIFGVLWCVTWLPRIREGRSLWREVPVSARGALVKFWIGWPLLCRHLGIDSDFDHQPSVERIIPTATGFNVLVKVHDDTILRVFSNKRGDLASRLGVKEVLPVLVAPGVLELRLKNDDLLAEPIDPVFFDRHPGSSRPTSLPVAVTEDGELFSMGLAHTLVIGATGSGKGSVLWAAIRSLLPAKRAGYVKFAGIDPKQTELKGLESVFDLGLAFHPSDTLRLLEELISELSRRQELGGRRFEVTRDMPFLVCFIDEFAAMSLGADRNEAKAIGEHFMRIMTQGRSAGIVVIALAQQPQKSVLGELRSQFVLRVALRVEGSIETSMVLGEGAVEDGATPHLLAPATATNDYQNAGVGWARSDTGELNKIRYPFTSEADIAAIINEFQEVSHV